MSFSNNETAVHKSELMSPPMTPKHNYDTALLSPHDRALDDDTALLPLLGSDGGTLRKASLPHTIRAIKLVNCDTLDTIGRRFSLPLEQQHRQQSRPSPRKKSVPKRSPSLSTVAAAGGVFTLNVFDRPKKACKEPPAISLPSPSFTDKPRPDTLFYDHVDLSIDDQAIYDSSWRPTWEPLDKKAAVRVTWKGSPLSIHALDYYHCLHPKEQAIASTLRLTPEQYLKCKRAMILTAKVFHQHGLPFRKSDAQKVCRIDVNKISCLWGAFNRLGWFQPR